MRWELTWKRYERRLVHPLRTRLGPLQRRSGVVVRLRGPGGVTGYGEAAPLPSHRTEALRDVISWLDGEGPRWEPSPFLGLPESLPALRFALGCALADAQGSWWLPPPEQPHMPVALLLDLEAADLVDRVMASLAAGWRTFKLKIGRLEPGEEMAVVGAVAALLPEGAQLRLDANGSLDLATAREWVRFTAGRVAVEFLEQPVTASDREGMLELSRDAGARIAVEEGLGSFGSAKTWDAAGWRSTVVAKPSLWGAPAEWGEVSTRVQWPWVFSSALETAIGQAHALRVAFALSRRPRAVGFGVDSWFEDDGLAGLVKGPLVTRRTVEQFRGDSVWNLL